MTTKSIETVPTKTTWKRPGVIWPIVLMSWPTISLILAIALYALTNMLFSLNEPTSSADMFGDEPTNPVRAILNVLFFILGGSAVALGPISFIVGLVLLIVNLNKK